MALGDGTGWDEANPEDTDFVSAGAAEIRDLRKGVRIRMEKEHTDFGGSSAGGEHLEGSAVAYHPADTDNMPSTKPDGGALDAVDEGRIAIVNQRSPWFLNSGQVWKSMFLRNSLAVTDSFSSWVDIQFPINGIIFSSDKGPSFAVAARTGENDTNIECGTVWVDGGTPEVAYFVIDIDQSTAGSERFRIKSGNSDWNCTLKYTIIP